MVGTIFYNNIVMAENLKNQIKTNSNSIIRLEKKVDESVNKLEINKLDKSIFEIVNTQLQRIESKLDRLQEGK